MACARVLSTSELGGERYATAAAAGVWPVEVRYRDAAAWRGRAAAVVLRAEARGDSSRAGDSGGGGGGGVQTVPFARAARAEWVVFVAVPAGPLAYAVLVDGAAVAAGGLDVRAPAAPLSLSPRIRSLQRAAAATGAVAGAGGVRFRFVERVFAVRDVFVEAQALPAGGAALRLRRVEDASGYDAFVGDAPLPAGKHAFRFRVVLKEPARPDAAPFTALGWDPAHSHSGGLATWEQVVEVRPGEGGSPPTAGAGAAAADAPKPAAEAPGPTEGAQRRSVEAPKAAAPKPAEATERDAGAGATTRAEGEQAAVQAPLSTGVVRENVDSIEAAVRSSRAQAEERGENKSGTVQGMNASAGAGASARESPRSIADSRGTEQAATDAAATEAEAPAEVSSGRTAGGRIGVVAVVCVGLVAIWLGLARGGGDGSEGQVFTRRGLKEKERNQTGGLSPREQYIRHSRGQGS